MRKTPVWAKTLQDYHEGRVAPAAKARHNITWIPVSSIAEQCYCELKVEHEYTLGEIPTEAKREGEEVHEQVIPMVKVSLPKLVSEIETREEVMVSMGLFGVVEGMGVAGIPDAVLFVRGVPEWVLELKTTRGSVDALWEDQALQVELYGLLLDLMGFDCSKLRLAVARLRHADVSDMVKEQLLEKIARSLRTDLTGNLEAAYEGKLKVHVIRHEKNEVTQRLNEKFGYWRSARSPFSSQSVGKCRACEFSASCPSSLYKPALP